MENGEELVPDGGFDVPRGVTESGDSLGTGGHGGKVATGMG